MGQTLENGVYLPSEGERNCYAGLKTNWEILDQKVADVTALQQAVAGALHREIVESLPTTDIDPNTIYMILSGTSATENVYNEYMYVNNAWELIGTSATDLTNYYTKAEVDGKLLLKASASDLTSHTGDTTIHVTASDKAKWNTVALIKQLRLVNTQVGSATTIAFANIDDTNGIKAGDKCMDLDGRMFEITAVDTANQTVTVGSALVDLALDANVVHTSGNENVGGEKTFSSDIIRGTASNNTTIQKKYIIGNYTASTTGSDSSSYLSIAATLNYSDGTPSKSASVILYVVENAYSTGKFFAFRPNSNNLVDLGTNNKRWANVFATNYYYGSNNVEFSTKFVTTDTNQTISGAKTFSSNVNVYNSDSTGNVSNIVLKNSKAEVGTEFAEQSINFVDKNNSPLATISCYGSSGNYTRLYITASDSNNNSEGIFIRKSITEIAILPTISSTVWMGNSTSPFYNVHTKRINGLTPSSLGMPVAPSSTSYVDISSYITVLDSSNPNLYTPSVNGYITFLVTGNQVQIFHDYGLQYKSSVQSGVANRGFYPVCAGVEYKIYVTASSIDRFWFIPCQGNV